MNPNEHPRMPGALESSLRQEPHEKRREMERVWQLLEDPDVDPVAGSADAAWADVVARLDSRSDRQPRRRSMRRRILRGNIIPLAVAATVLIAAAVVWLTYRPVTVGAEVGTQRTAWLPDGSGVELNSDSQVEYTRQFRSWPFWTPGPRHVKLEGEAYFRVVSDARPFVVETEDAFIEVLGTEFNVRSRQDMHEGGTLVTLASGRLQIRPVGDTENIALLAEPGASAEITHGGATASYDGDAFARLDHVLAWRHRGFASIDRPLGSILNELERRFAMQIAPREGVDQNESMSLFYPRGAVPEQILRDVCLVQDCRFRETSRGFALAPAPPDGGRSAEGSQVRSDESTARK